MRPSECSSRPGRSASASGFSLVSLKRSSANASRHAANAAMPRKIARQPPNATSPYPTSGAEIGPSAKIAIASAMACASAGP